MASPAMIMVDLLASSGDDLQVIPLELMRSNLWRWFSDGEGWTPTPGWVLPQISWGLVHNCETSLARLTDALVRCLQWCGGYVEGTAVTPPRLVWKRCLKDLVAPKVRCLRRVPKKRDDGVNSGHAGHLFVPLGKSHEFPYTTMEQTHHHKSAQCMQRFSSHLRNLLVRPAGQPICCTWLEVSSKETITLRRYKESDRCLSSLVCRFRLSNAASKKMYCISKTVMIQKTFSESTAEHVWSPDWRAKGF